MKKLLVVIFAALFLPAFVNAQHIEVLQQGKPTSFRGLSVVDDHVAWVSGSKGTIAITKDGGRNWDWKQVKGFEKSDFRDIEAFSAKEAIIMSSGTPALILKTTDGGETWQTKYRNTDSAYFFDAMDFDSQKHGFVLGDPIGGKFVLMETTDAGESWHEFKNQPDALPGEACFAASGTCLKIDRDMIHIVTGGSHSRWLNLDLRLSGQWIVSNLQIKHGKPSQGAFSIANGSCDIIVGGDYQDEHSTDSVAIKHCWASRNDELKISFPIKPPAGYQSCVEWINSRTFLSTGTPGSNLTADDGKTWRKIDDASYNVCRKAKNGKLVLLAGDQGKIGVFKK
ncbi:MAG TPA: YCF48-related protein [Mucilaginibacter sp.]|nr:YCF48-related protein [Mucilaginibacter sp.]